MRTGMIRCFALLTLATSTAVVAADLKSEEDKTMYALGAALGRSVVPFNLTPAELELVKAGLTDAATSKKPQVDINNYMPKLQDLQKTRLAATEQAYMAKAATGKGITKTASGLLYSVVKAGTGASPKSTDTVKVHYTGKLTNGEVFDSSVERNEPAEFPLNGVIPCWTEGVQLMKVGGKSRLVCPAATAYGERGSPPKIGPGATLVFDIELLEILKKS
jgi:FKBP-type peptidyl-prolyl cis-trans isomerase FkpA